MAVEAAGSILLFAAEDFSVVFLFLCSSRGRIRLNFELLLHPLLLALSVLKEHLPAGPTKSSLGLKERKKKDYLNLALQTKGGRGPTFIPLPWHMHIRKYAPLCYQCIPVTVLFSFCEFIELSVLRTHSTI